MAPDPDNGLTSPLGPQPGINGIRHAARTNIVYYTSTAQKLFMRVAVDPATHKPVGQPEVVAADITADDFCLDENTAVAYLTTHTDNTIVRVPINAGADGATASVVAGDPFNEQLVGPSSAAWARGRTDYGRIAYVTTDGGHTAIEYHRPGSDEIIRPARVVRVQSDPERPADERPMIARQRTNFTGSRLTSPPTNAFPTDRSNSWPPPSVPSKPAPSASARPTAPPT